MLHEIIIMDIVLNSAICDNEQINAAVLISSSVCKVIII